MPPQPALHRRDPIHHPTHASPPPPHLPPPRARCSTPGGSSEAGRPVGWRGQAVDTGWPRPAPICSARVACTEPPGSACPLRMCGCRRSSSPPTSCGDRGPHGEGRGCVSRRRGQGPGRGTNLHNFPPAASCVQSFSVLRAVSQAPAPSNFLISVPDVRPPLPWLSVSLGLGNNTPQRSASVPPTPTFS